MKFTLKTLALPAIAFCATAAFAANLARVDVPFSFTAQGQSYPAGRYEVTTDTNHNFVTLANEMDASKQLTWVVGPAEAAKMPTVVTFDQAGNWLLPEDRSAGRQDHPESWTFIRRRASARRLRSVASRTRVCQFAEDANWQDFQAGSLRAKGAYGTTPRCAS